LSDASIYIQQSLLQGVEDGTLPKDLIVAILDLRNKQSMTAAMLVALF
jgi:hypothetical protein